MIKFFSIIALSVGLLACAQESSTKTEKQVTTKKAEAPTIDTEVHWLTVNEALELQQKEPKKIIMDFYTNWCGPCKLLEKNTFQNPDVAQYINEHFYAVKFNAEGNELVNFKGKEFSNPNYKDTKGRGYQHQFAQAFQVSAYPTIIFLDENLDFIFPMKGYVEPKGIEPTLKVIASNAYKNIKTREEFESWKNETFTSTFK